MAASGGRPRPVQNLSKNFGSAQGAGGQENLGAPDGSGGPVHSGDGLRKWPANQAADQTTRKLLRTASGPLTWDMSGAVPPS